MSVDHSLDVSFRTDESSSPNRVTGIYSRTQHSDGTLFPENFLEHESVMGCPTNKSPNNKVVDETLERYFVL